VIRTDAETLTAVISGALQAEAACASGSLAIEGGPTAVSRAATLITPRTRPERSDP
jgi:hypothetical protein